MAAITDYSSLQTNLQSWLWNRSDVTAQIPTFIQLFEAQANRILRTRLMRAMVDVTVSGEFLDVPDDFAGSRSFNLDTDPVTQLEFAVDDDEIENMKQLYQDATTGNPTTYAVVGTQFQFFPVPTTSIPGHLRYWAKIPSLSDSAATNWLLLAHPDFYLYGSLLQSAPWLRDDDRFPVWTAAYQTILDQIGQDDDFATSAPRLSIPLRATQTP